MKCTALGSSVCWGFQGQHADVGAVGVLVDATYRCRAADAPCWPHKALVTNPYMPCASSTSLQLHCSVSVASDLHKLHSAEIQSEAVSRGQVEVDFLLPGAADSTVTVVNQL